MLAGARSPEISDGSGQGWAVPRRYMDDLDGADVRSLAIHKRVSRLNTYKEMC